MYPYRQSRSNRSYNHPSPLARRVAPRRSTEGRSPPLVACRHTASETPVMIFRGTAGNLGGYVSPNFLHSSTMGFASRHGEPPGSRLRKLKEQAVTIAESGIVDVERELEASQDDLHGIQTENASNADALAQVCGHMSTLTVEVEENEAIITEAQEMIDKLNQVNHQKRTLFVELNANAEDLDLKVRNGGVKQDMAQRKVERIQENLEAVETTLLGAKKNAKMANENVLFSQDPLSTLQVEAAKVLSDLNNTKLVVEITKVSLDKQTKENLESLWQHMCENHFASHKKCPNKLKDHSPRGVTDRPRLKGVSGMKDKDELVDSILLALNPKALPDTTRQGEEPVAYYKERRPCQNEAQH